MARLRTTIYCAATTFASVLLVSNPAIASLSNAQPPSAVFESLWKRTLPDGPAAPAAFDPVRAFIPLRNGQLIAVALSDGHTLWTVDSPTTLRPAVGDMLLFVADKTAIRALNVADGRQRWRAATDDVANVAPVFAMGWLFVGTANGELSAFRASDGELLWKRKIGAPLSAVPAPSAESIYVPLSDGRLVAVDVQTGEIVWMRQLPGTPSEILALDDRLFFGADDNYFYCVALKDGDVKWRWRTGADIVSPPVVDETRVYFTSLDNVLRALDRGSGSQRWQQQLSYRTAGGALRSGSLLVVAPLSPQLQAYQRTDGKPAGSSPPPEGDEVASTLAAPPQKVSLDGREAFVLLTHQGLIQLFGMPTS